MTTSPKYLRLAELADDKEGAIRRAISLEAASYPIDEAATEFTVRFRLKHAPAFFMAAYLSDNPSEDAAVLVGFINGTLSPSGQLDEDAMSRHDPSGSVLCIHSVVIDPAFRRVGYGAQMLKEYTATICASHTHVKRILLIAKAHLVKFYVDCGYVVTRQSPVVHGTDPWFELELDCEAARRPVIVQVDAFTEEAFQGVPVAVVLLSSANIYHKDSALDWMQRVAVETNLCETTFVAPRRGLFKTNSALVEYDLRSLTPGTQVEPSVYAVLSAALALLDSTRVTTSQSLRFHTTSRRAVHCHFNVQCNIDNVLLVLDVDSELDVDCTDANVAAQRAVASALRVSPHAIVDVQHVATDLLVRVTPAAFVTLAPDVKQLVHLNVRDVVVTAAAPRDNRSASTVATVIHCHCIAPRDKSSSSSSTTTSIPTASAYHALSLYWTRVLHQPRVKVQQQEQPRVPSRRSIRSVTADVALLEHSAGSRLSAHGVVVRRGTLASLIP